MRSTVIDMTVRVVAPEDVLSSELVALREALEARARRWTKMVEQKREEKNAD